LASIDFTLIPKNNIHISDEMFEQTETRLEKRVKAANFRIFERLYYFMEILQTEFVFNKEALVFVKDNEIWGLLMPETKNDS
jgi:hypothetical protein